MVIKWYRWSGPPPDLARQTEVALLVVDYTMKMSLFV
jgi:hypothetical protein